MNVSGCEFADGLSYALEHPARTGLELHGGERSHPVAMGSARIDKTLLAALRKAGRHGAVLLACHDALHAHGLARESLIPGRTRRGRAVQFMARACDPAWRTLVF